jgi:hypothetical protein
MLALATKELPSQEIGIEALNDSRDPLYLEDERRETAVLPS